MKLPSDFCIIYSEMSDEVPIASLPLFLPKRQVQVGLDYNIDPFIYAKETIEIFGTKQGFILIPGRRFDTYGGRKGRGKGWYDKFLLKLPKHWVRIGVCKKNDFFDTKIALNQWDELMDWVIVSDGVSFFFYETFARQGKLLDIGHVSDP